MGKRKNILSAEEEEHINSSIFEAEKIAERYFGSLKKINKKVEKGKINIEEGDEIKIKSLLTFGQVLLYLLARDDTKKA